MGILALIAAKVTYSKIKERKKKREDLSLGRGKKDYGMSTDSIQNGDNLSDTGQFFGYKPEQMSTVTNDKYDASGEKSVYTTGIAREDEQPETYGDDEKTLKSYAAGAKGLGDDAERKLVKVVRPYEAALSDELTLIEGDLIAVDEIFDDDWAVGRNESTGEVGMFPMVCVSSANSGSEAGMKKGKKKNIGSRGYSLVYSANVGL